MSDDDKPVTEVLPAAKMAELEKVHGEVVAVKTAAGPAAFRVFKRQEYQRFNSMLVDDKKKHMALEYIALACCVYPSPEQFQAMVDRKPGIIASCANAVLEHGGVDGDPVVGKSPSASARETQS